MSLKCAQITNFFKSFIPEPNQCISNRTHMAATATIAAIACASFPLAAILGTSYITTIWKWNSRTTSAPLVSQQAKSAIARLIPIKSNGLENDAKEELTGFARYKLLLAENERNTPRELVMPQRRRCALSGHESARSQAAASDKTLVFVKDEEIIEVHPMRFLRNSPFVEKLRPVIEAMLQEDDPNDPSWGPSCDSLTLNLHAIGQTEDNRHVILQQTAKSCVPSCVGMLVLDKQSQLAEQLALCIKITNLANREDAERWVKEAGLTPEITTLNDLTHAAETLKELIQRNGPGILSIRHPVLSGHAIVLDKISIEKNSALIRDSFHGWSLTMKLAPLLSWIHKNHNYFLQIRSDG